MKGKELVRRMLDFLWANRKRQGWFNPNFMEEMAIYCGITLKLLNYLIDKFMYITIKDKGEVIRNYRLWENHYNYNDRVCLTVFSEYLIIGNMMGDTLQPTKYYDMIIHEVGELFDKELDILNITL